MLRLKTHLLIALSTLCCGMLIGTQLHFIGSKTEAKTGATTADDKELIQALQRKKVHAFYTWNDTYSDEALLCLVQTFDKDPNWEGSGMKLTIFNPSGEPIYQDYFESLIRVYETSALRDLSSQLVYEAVYGGTGTYHLRMLDYRNGKIVKLLGGEDGVFNADAEVRPQFRSETIPAEEHFQVLLTEGVGLASPMAKVTRVYRYKNGSYKHVGTFPQKKLDDYMESLLKESRQR